MIEPMHCVPATCCVGWLANLDAVENVELYRLITQPELTSLHSQATNIFGQIFWDLFQMDEQNLVAVAKIDLPS
jgi:hypothetical protein